MSLDVVRPGDAPRGCPKHYKDWDYSLTTVDINKAQPSFGHDCSPNNDPMPWKLYQKPPPEFTKGSRAETRYPPISPTRPRDLALTTSDIEAAQPRRIGINCEGKARLDAAVDPQLPLYTFASSHTTELLPPPPSSRNTLDVRDINSERNPNGSTPFRPHGDVSNPLRLEDDFRSRSRAYGGAAGNTASGTRIPLSPRTTGMPGTLPPRREGPQLTGRATDPLEPGYRVPVASGVPGTSLHCNWDEEKTREGATQPPVESQSIGRVDGAAPRQRTWDNGEPFLSLTAADLPGASPLRRIGRMPYNMYGPAGNRMQSASLATKDIEGAQAGTIRRGPKLPRAREEAAAQA